MGFFETSSRLIGIAICLLLLIFIVDLVRRRKLSEQYSVIWILSVLTGLLLMVFDGILGAIGRFIGATNLSSTLFLMGILFILGILLNLTTKLSSMSTKLRQINQELGLLREALDRKTEHQAVRSAGQARSE